MDNEQISNEQESSNQVMNNVTSSDTFGALGNASINNSITNDSNVIETTSNKQMEYVSSGIGENVTDNNNSVNYDLNNNINVERKKSKLPFIIIIVVFVLLVVMGVLYFIITKSFTASNYVDETVKLANKFIDDTIADVGVEQINLLKDDIKTTGAIGLTSNDPTLASFNNLNLRYDIVTSLNNDSIDATYTISQGTASLNGEIALQKDTMYLDFKNILDKTLKYNIGANIFTDIKNSLTDINTINPNDAKKLLKNMIGYLGETLKNAKTKATIKGLNIEYSFIVDDENKTKVSNIFNNLIKNDEIYKKLNSISNVTGNGINTNYSIDSLKYVVTVNMLSKEVMNGKLAIKDTVINIDRVEKNKYKLYLDKDSSNYCQIDVSKGLDAKIYVNNNLSYSLSVVNSSNKSTINFNDIIDNILFNIETTKVDDKNNNIVISANVDGFKANAEFKNTFDINSYVVDGNVILNYNNYETKFTINNGLKYDKSLLTTKNFTNIIDYNNLTINEQNTYILKLISSLSNFKFMQDYLSLLYLSATSATNNDFNLYS